MPIRLVTGRLAFAWSAMTGSTMSAVYVLGQNP